MPITKSAKKSLKVSKTKQSINRKNEIALAKGLKKASKENINEVIALVDKAAKNNLIHKNKAARLKSSLAKKFGTPPAKQEKVKTEKKTTESKSKAKSPKTKSKSKA